MAINLKLFPTKAMADTTPEVYPQVTATLPDTPRVVDPFAAASGAATEFNLVRIVEEHGPKRLERIDKEIAKLEAKVNALVREREQVQALVLALTK